MTLGPGYGAPQGPLVTESMSKDGSRRVLRTPVDPLLITKQVPSFPLAPPQAILQWATKTTRNANLVSPPLRGPESFKSFPWP